MLLFSIYNKFKLKKWQKLTPGKRQQVLEKVEKKQAKKLGRQALPVVINSNPNWGSYGMFECAHGKKILYLSIKLISDVSLRFHALETIMHEGRHAYQYEVCTKQKLKFYQIKEKHWKENYSGYINSAEDNTYYNMQPIERDAQRYAIKQLKSQKFRFSSEHDYQVTLANMIYRYQETERRAKTKSGLFYKYKIRRKIKDKIK